MSRKNTGRTPPQNLQNLQQAEARQLARLTSSSQLDSRTLLVYSKPSKQDLVRVPVVFLLVYSKPSKQDLV